MKKEISGEEAIQKLRKLRNLEEYKESWERLRTDSFEESKKQAKNNREQREKRKHNRMEYFQLAKSLNCHFHDILAEKKAHFRGNTNSCSLVSLDPQTPEIGISKINKKNAESKLFGFNPKKPGRVTFEKELQAWIILNAIQNKYLLPFGDGLTFITSELAIVLKDNKRIVNDILAIDKDDNLVVIELKSLRVNEVKDQAIKFKEVIESDPIFFSYLTELMTDRSWSGTIRCMVVWPKSEGKARAMSQEYGEVEIYEYYDNFKFEICK